MKKPPFKPNRPGAAKPGFAASRPQPGAKPFKLGPKPAAKSGPDKTGLNGLDLLYGVHAAKAAFENPQRRFRHIWCTEAMEREVAAWRQSHHPSVTVLDKAELERLLPKGAVHQGVAVAAEPLPEIFLTDLIVQAQTRPYTVLVMLDEVTDPHNIGAILRSMAAFGAHGVITHRYNSPGVTGTLAKTATGALEHVSMVEVTNLARSLHELTEAGFLTVGCDERATHAIDTLPQSDKIVLVLGAEGKGLRPSTRAQCNIIATIPTTGPIASLNVSNAAAIALFCLQRAALKY